MKGNHAQQEDEHNNGNDRRNNRWNMNRNCGSYSYKIMQERIVCR